MQRAIRHRKGKRVAGQAARRGAALVLLNVIAKDPRAVLRAVAKA